MFKSLINLSRPILLLLAALTYSLGAGMAHYLGKPVSIAPFVFGGLAILALLASSSLFAEYFRLPLSPLKQGETPRLREHFRVTLLEVSYAGLSLSAIAILTLLLTKSLNLPSDILIVLALLFLLAYSI